MDFGLYFIIAILMAIGTYIIGRMYGRKVVAVIKRVLALSLILPMLLMALFATIDMQNAEQDEVYEIRDNAIEEIVDYTTGKLPYVLISDIVGIAMGSIALVFRGRR